ncbi:MAG: hypothetical protein JWO32_283 [Bacteroidetes bacterium]|nr:hypothetical protein [Bacteroidota bacterium]
MNKHFHVLCRCKWPKLFVFLCLAASHHSLSAQVSGARKINANVKVECEKFSNRVDIEFSALKEISNLLVLITDSLGQTIFLDNQYRFKGNYKIHADLSNNLKGKYTVRIIGDEQKIDRKIDVQ